jgi:L-lactate dehydrogenase complex protein LldG
MSDGARNREAVLSRIRARLGTHDRPAGREAEVSARFERHPRGTVPARAFAPPAKLLELFETMLTSQGAEMMRVGTPEKAVRAIAGELAANNMPLALRMGSDPILAALPWGEAPNLERRYGKPGPDDRASLSRAAVAAAETGTLFLVSGADNPTGLAFLPETHFVLITATDILGCYEDAFDRIRAFHGNGKLPRSVNMVSGPSRTADIEQTIVRGAHGPKRLVVLLLA